MTQNYRNKVLSGFAWEAFTKLFIQIISWVSTILVARILSPDDYGLILISGIFTGLFTMLANFGIANGIVCRDSISVREQSTLFWLVTFIGVFFYTLLYALAGVLSDWYEIPELAGVIQVAGIMVVLSNIHILPHSMMMRKLNFKFSSIINLISKLILITTTLILAYSGFEYWSLIWSTIIAEAFVVVAYLCYLDERPRLVFSILEVRDILRSGSIVLVSRVVGFWNDSSAGVIVSIFLGKVDAGYLQMANTLAAIPLSKVGEIFDRVAFPSIAAIKGDRKRAKNVFLVMHRYLLFITVPMFTGIAVSSEQIVVLFLGDKWSIIASALQVLCFMNVIRVSTRLMPRVLEGVGQPKYSLFFQVINAFIIPIGMLIGVSYGLTGVLLGWLMSLPVVYIVLFKIVNRVLDLELKEFIRTIIHPILGSLCIIFIATLVDYLLGGVSLSLILILKIFFCAVAFCVYYLIFDPNQLKEIIMMAKRYR